MLKEVHGTKNSLFSNNYAGPSLAIRQERQKNNFTVLFTPLITKTAGWLGVLLFHASIISRTRPALLAKSIITTRIFVMGD